MSPELTVIVGAGTLIGGVGGLISDTIESGYDWLKGISYSNTASSPYGPDGKFTPDAGAVVDLAKGAKQQGGVTEDDAQTLVDWGKEAGFGDAARGPENHGGASGEHIHVGPVSHIPVKPNGP